jgi:CRP-like cAMP-binding protein
MLQPVETVKILQRNGNPRTCSPGEIIFQQGEQAQAMYGILEGEVDILVDGQAVETIKAGDVFGAGALIHPEHARTSTAIAKTECQLVSLDRERFLFAVQETPVFALEVMRSLSARLRYLRQPDLTVD